MTRHELAARMAAGEEFTFFAFYGHAQGEASCLSQWACTPFELDGVRYPTSEHYMMAEKARLFGDSERLAAILEAAGPREAKALGRQVVGYDDARWGAARVDAVVRGNLAKFGQDPALLAFLLGTGDQVLVEAAPRDTVWGVGLGKNNPAIADPARWRGRNLLGFALMEVRAQLAARS
jgi:ribA/ribD-fused uncharacterized protein